MSPAEIAALRARLNNEGVPLSQHIQNALLDAAEEALRLRDIEHAYTEAVRLNDDIGTERDRLRAELESRPAMQLLPQRKPFIPDSAVENPDNEIEAERDRLAAALRKTRDILAALQHMDTRELVASINAVLKGVDGA